MRIIYCTYSEVPSKSANSIAVMNQCASLANKVSLKVILIKGNQKEQYTRTYNVPLMDITFLPSCFLWFNEMGIRLYVLLYALAHSGTICYSRDIFINNTLCRFHIPNYYEIHQIQHQSQGFRFRKRFIRSLNFIAQSNYTKKIICISKTLKKKCVNQKIPMDKLAVLHSGVDTSLLYSKNSSIQIPLFDKEQPLAIYSGSFQQGKGVETVVSMSKLGPCFNFLIIGGNKGEITESGNLKHIPHISHADVLELLKQANYLLLPMTDQSYEYYSPLKLFEYMAAGRVVIASDLEVTREIINHKSNGLLATPSNPMSFIENMELITHDKELQKRIESNAIKTAAKYTWERRSELIIKMMQKDFSI